MDELRRKLSAFEANFAKTAAGIMCVRFTARGVLHTDAMLKAFAALRTEHPELAGRLEPVEGGYDLVANRCEPSPVEKFVRVIQGDPDARLPHELDISETLSGLDLVSQGERHLLVFWVSHCVADGFRAFYLAVRLGSLYTKLLEHGSAGDLLVQPLPKSPDQLLLERGAEKSDAAFPFDRVAGIRWSGRMPKADDLPEGDLQPVRRQASLDPDTSAKLRAAAKKLDCTMHGLVAGAIAVAERSNFTDVPDGEQVLLCIASVVEMRGRVSPPVSPAEVTIFANWSLKRLDLANGSDPVAVGRSVAEQLREDLDSGILQQGLLHPPPENNLVPIIAVNNMGNIPFPPTPPELVIEGYDPIFEVDLNPLRAVVEALPEGMELPSPVGPFYVIYFYADMFHIDVWNIPGALPVEAQDRVLGRIVELLTSIAEGTE
jgi:hypothetical protein